MRASTPALGCLTRPTVRVWITVCRSTLSQHNRRKDGFHFNKRNCFSLELKAEIINAVDMKRKTKAQIYRDYKYNIKMFAWNILYLLEDKEAMKHNPKAQDTLVTSAIKIVISIEVSQPQCCSARHCMTSAAVFIRDVNGIIKNSLKMRGSRGCIGPGGVKGQHPRGGPKGATLSGRNWIFTLLQLKNWPLLDRSWLKSEG